MATTTTMSGAAFDRLPYEEGRRLELLYGQVIEVPSRTPAHQCVAGILIHSLLGYLRSRDAGFPLPNSEFALREDIRLSPDLAVLLGDRWTSLNRRKTPIPGPPDIAIEITSPSERTVDSDRKVWAYLDAGAREVWEMRPESRKILVFRGPKSITALAAGETLTSPLLPGWEIPVSEIFAD